MGDLVGTDPDRRAAVIGAIRSLTKKYGYSPTVREIGIATGIPSTEVYRYLHALKRDGVVDFIPRSPRTIRLVKAPTR